MAKRKRSFIFGVLAATIIFSFQNCGNALLSLREPVEQEKDGEEPYSVTVPETPKKKPYAERKTDLDQTRIELWGQKLKRSTFGYEVEWDIEFDGTDSAADNVPNPFRWDSSIDDDWNFPQFGFKLNYPRKGIMTVDRITSPGSYDKTGNIWRRDEYLSHQTGVTIELAVQLLRAPYYAYMQKDAFSIVYLDDAGSFGLHLSPDGAKAGGLNPDQPYDWQEYSYDFTAYSNIIRIYKYPGDDYFYWYIGLIGPFYGKIDAEPAYRAKYDGSYYSFPRILIGDNSNALNKNAMYELDYVRYRRGPVPHFRNGTTLETKAPPPLPENETEADARNWYGVWNTPMSTNPHFSEVYGQWNFTDKKTNILDGRNSPALIRNGSSYTGPNLTGLGTGGDFTIELKVKVLEGHTEDGFVFEYFDTLGGSIFALSKDKITVYHSTNVFGKSEYKMDTTDDFHTYRLVRRCPSVSARGCMYTHLYVDNDPIPLDFDRHIDGTVLGRSRLTIGSLAYLKPGSKAHVEIEHIKWQGKALAPKLD